MELFVIIEDLINQSFIELFLGEVNA